MSKQTAPCDYCGKIPCGHWDLAVHPPLEPGESVHLEPGRITTPCPACGSRSLFIGNGGGLTCAVLRCPNPSPYDEVQALRAALEDALCTLIAIAAQPATAGRLWAENPTLGTTLARVRAALRQHEPVDPLKRMA